MDAAIYGSQESAIVCMYLIKQQQYKSVESTVVSTGDVITTTVTITKQTAAAAAAAAAAVAMKTTRDAVLLKIQYQDRQCNIQSVL